MSSHLMRHMSAWLPYSIQSALQSSMSAMGQPLALDLLLARWANWRTDGFRYDRGTARNNSFVSFNDEPSESSLLATVLPLFQRTWFELDKMLPRRTKGIKQLLVVHDWMFQDEIERAFDESSLRYR